MAQKICGRHCSSCFLWYSKAWRDRLLSPSEASSFFCLAVSPVSPSALLCPRSVQSICERLWGADCVQRVCQKYLTSQIGCSDVYQRLSSAWSWRDQALPETRETKDSRIEKEQDNSCMAVFPKTVKLNPCACRNKQISFWVICQMFPPPKLYTACIYSVYQSSYYHLWRGLMTPLLSVCSTALFQPHPMTISAG